MQGRRQVPRVRAHVAFGPVLAKPRTPPQAARHDAGPPRPHQIRARRSCLRLAPANLPQGRHRAHDVRRPAAVRAGPDRLDRHRPRRRRPAERLRGRVHRPPARLRDGESCHRLFSTQCTTSRCTPARTPLSTAPSSRIPPRAPAAGRSETARCASRFPRPR